MEAVINADEFYEKLYSICVRCKSDIPNPLDSAHKGICDSCILQIMTADD